MGSTLDLYSHVIPGMRTNWRMPWRKYRAEISCEDFPSTFCPWIVHSGEKETPDCNGRGFSYGLKSGDFVPSNVDGSGRESNRPARIVTRHNDFKSGIDLFTNVH